MLFSKSIAFLSTKAPILITLILLIPIGLGTKFYHGPGQAWIHQYAGDIFYPMFWFFLGMLIVQGIKPVFMGLLIFLFSTVVEFTQLFDNPALSFLRQTFIGRTLVGTSFVPMDIFYYLVGSVCAVLLYYLLSRMNWNPKSHHELH